ncbi:MAG: hypothetical protein ACPGSB_02650 [Opitutales bacterium]
MNLGPLGRVKSELNKAKQKAKETIGGNNGSVIPPSGAQQAAQQLAEKGVDSLVAPVETVLDGADAAQQMAEGDVTPENVAKATAAAIIVAELLDDGEPSESAKSQADKRSESGSEIDPADKSGTRTMAGRALDKHGSTQGKRSESSAFPPATGNTQEKNQQGQDQLDDILTDPDQTSYPNGSGGEDVHSKDGRGARFDKGDNFTGFLEPRREESEDE